MQHVFLNDYQVVLCYSRRDERLMQRLRDDLQAADIQAWTGDYLKPESNYWTSSLLQAIEQADSVVILLTPNAKYAPPVRQAVDTARRLGVPINLLLAKGDVETSLPDDLQNVPWLDIRNQVQFFQNLAIPELLRALHRPPATEDKHRAPWNPLHQLRLLVWLFRQPQRVTDYQQELGTRQMRKVASWLSTSLVLVAAWITALGNLIYDGNWVNMLVLTVALILWIYIAVRTEMRGAALNYVFSFVLAVGVTAFVLPIYGIALESLDDWPRVQLDGWLYALSMPVVGGIALGIGETLQSKRILVPLVTPVSALALGICATSLMAPYIVDSGASEAGAIAVLTLLGTTVAILAITILYVIAFLTADYLIKSVFVRGVSSRWGRQTPLMLLGIYVSLLIIGLLDL